MTWQNLGSHIANLLSVGACAFSACSFIACTPAGVPLPPELAQANEHYDVVPSATLFSLENELQSGPYRLKVVRHEREDRQQKAGGVKRIRLMSYELALFQGGREAGTAKCIERLAYTDARGDNMGAEGVEDSLSCDGKDGQGVPWTLKTTLQESGDASGFFEQEKLALKITSLQRAALASRGQIRGFQIADERGAQVATQRVSSNAPGGMWIRTGSVPSDALVAASFALTLYVPMR